MNHFESSVKNLIWTKKLVLLYWYKKCHKILVQNSKIYKFTENSVNLKNDK